MEVRFVRDGLFLAQAQGLYATPAMQRKVPGPFLMKVKRLNLCLCSYTSANFCTLAGSQVHRLHLPRARLLPPSLTRGHAAHSTQAHSTTDPAPLLWAPIHARQDQHARQHRPLRCSFHVQPRDLPVALPDCNWSQ